MNSEDSDQRRTVRVPAVKRRIGQRSSLWNARIGRAIASATLSVRSRARVWAPVRQHDMQESNCHARAKVCVALRPRRVPGRAASGPAKADANPTQTQRGHGDAELRGEMYAFRLSIKSSSTRAHIAILRKYFDA
jgi:hypothetical protein